MVKAKTTISLEGDTLKKARDHAINISALTESAILKKTGAKIDSEEEDITCSKCGRKEEPASRDNGYIGMTWLCPDEVWVCSRCLNEEVKKVTIGLVSRR